MDIIKRMQVTTQQEQQPGSGGVAEAATTTSLPLPTGQSAPSSGSGHLGQVADSTHRSAPGVAIRAGRGWASAGTSTDPGAGLAWPGPYGFRPTP